MHVTAFQVLPRTFLSLVKDWRAGMIVALFRRVGEFLAAALMDTFLRHAGQRLELKALEDLKRSAVTS